MTRFLTVWPAMPAAALVRRPSTRLPFPLGAPGASVHLRGRHALYHGVRALGLGPGDEVLAPAWHHGSEIEALIGAAVTCRFYEATPDLEPDENELEALLGPRVRALHLTHVLGFPVDTGRWRRWCDERGLLLLEDAAQAWLATTTAGAAGAGGDLGIFGLYTMLALPSSGALVLRDRDPVGTPVDALQPVKLARHAARAVVEGSITLDRLVFGRRGRRPYVPEEDFALGDPDARPTSALPGMVRRLAWPDAAAVRRANYRELLDRFADVVPPPFDAVPSGASPMAFPVEVDDKGPVLAGLNARGVAPLDFWSVPHPALPASAFPAAARRRARTVAVPVHHQLGRRGLRRVADALAAALVRPA